MIRIFLRSALVGLLLSGMVFQPFAALANSTHKSKLVSQRAIKARGLKVRGKYALIPNWVSSRPGQRTTDQGKIEWRTFIRYVPAGKHSFKIGNITYLKFPKPGGADPKELRKVLTPDLMAQDLAQGLGIKKWQKRKVGTASAFESAWRNRYVRVFIKETPTHFAYSIAFLRTTYAHYAVIESEIIQRTLHGEGLKKTASLQEWIRNIEFDLFPKAYAQVTCATCATQPSSLQIYCYAICIMGGTTGTTESGTAGPGTTGGSTGNPLFDSLQNLSTQLPLLTNEAGRLNDNLEAAMPRVDRLTDSVDNLNVTAQEALPRVDQLNQNLSNIDQTANRAIDEAMPRVDQLNENLSNIDQTANRAIDEAMPRLDQFNQNLSNIDQTANRGIDVLQNEAIPQISRFNDNIENITAVIDTRSADFLDLGERALAEISVVGNSVAESVSGIAVSIESIAGNAEIFNQTLVDIGQMGEAESQAWREEFRNQAQQVNDTLSHTSREVVSLLRTALEPGNFMKYVAAYRAASMLTGMAVGFAVSSISAGLGFLMKSIYNLITGSDGKSSAELIAQFRQAIDQYDRISKSIQELENQIDSLLALLQQTPGMARVPTEDLLTDLRFNLRQAQNRQRVYDQKAQEALLANNAQCEAEWTRKAVLEEQNESQILALLGALENNRTVNACSRMEGLLNQLVEAEWIREGAFSDILNAENDWYKLLEERQEENRRNMRRARDPGRAEEGRDIILGAGRGSQHSSEEEAESIFNELRSVCQRVTWEFRQGNQRTYTQRNEYCENGYNMAGQTPADFIDMYLPHLNRPENSQQREKAIQRLAPTLGKASDDKLGEEAGLRSAAVFAETAERNYQSRMQHLSKLRPNELTFAEMFRESSELFNRVREEQAQVWGTFASLLSKGHRLAEVCQTQIPSR